MVSTGASALAKAWPPQHAAFGRALGARGADIVLAQRLDHGAAHEARVAAELHQR